MASKPILGIDVGRDQLKIVQVENGTVLYAVKVAMPENLYKEGEFTSAETLADLIARTLKENGIKSKEAAYVVPNEKVYIKNVRVPEMTADQLALNLPYEFNDYITGEIKDYIFDYAMLPDDEEPEEAPVMPGEELEDEPERTMNIMAVGVERKDIEEIQRMLSKCGLKLVKAAPPISSYIELIRSRGSELGGPDDEYGILDLGYESIRMYIFKGDRHEATRVLENGLSTLDSVVADLYNVEIHLAHTYILNNFENCLEREECRETYDNIAVELMRAMNFYRFSNPNSTLSDVWLCGGGAFNRPLTDTIGQILDMRLHTASELVEEGDEIPGVNSFVQAVGITMGDE